MTQSAPQAQTIAQNVLNAQIANIPGLTNTNLSVTIQNSGLGRTAPVAYQAQSANVFPGIFKNSWSISGSSQAASAIPPNIDFYLLLDNSPSMAVAATPADITTMVNATQSQGGCAFACHESNPAADNLGNPGGVDNYTLAQQLGMTTRIAVLRSATQQLMDTATPDPDPLQQSVSDGHLHVRELARDHCASDVEPVVSQSASKQRRRDRGVQKQLAHQHAKQL